MGIPHQIPLDLPADLALKMASGQYVITDVVVRSVTSGRYAHFLPVDKVTKTVEKTVALVTRSPLSLRSLTRFVRTPAGLATVGGGGAAVALLLGISKLVIERRQDSKQRRHDVIERANTAMVAYLAAAHAASLDTDTIDELIAALEAIQTLPVTGEAIDLDLMARLIREHTAQLAKANGVAAATAAETRLAPVVRTVDHLAQQRGLFDQAS